MCKENDCRSLNNSLWHHLPRPLIVAVDTGDFILVHCGRNSTDWLYILYTKCRKKESYRARRLRNRKTVVSLNQRLEPPPLRPERTVRERSRPVGKPVVRQMRRRSRVSLPESVLWRLTTHTSSEKCVECPYSQTTVQNVYENWRKHGATCLRDRKPGIKQLPIKLTATKAERRPVDRLQKRDRAVGTLYAAVDLQETSRTAAGLPRSSWRDNRPSIHSNRQR